MRERSTGIARSVAVALAAALLLAAAACAPEGATAAGPQSNVEVIQQAIKDARAGGASEHQIQVLGDALDVGEVTFDDLDSLVGDVYACLDAAGRGYTPLSPNETTVGSGVFEPQYSVAIPASDASGETTADLVDACQLRNISFAMTAYVNQPWAALADLLAQDTPQVRSCLADRGYAVDDEATVAELSALVSQDLEEHSQDPGYPGPCTPH
jgi:type IV secretory pathway VirB2 component (pilin)